MVDLVASGIPDVIKVMVDHSIVVDRWQANVVIINRGLSCRLIISLNLVIVLSLDCSDTLLVWWCHLRANFLRWRIALNPDLIDHGSYEFGRLGLGQFFLSLGALFLSLLNLD